jgi:glycosyltransferase involved in cell wall biosynthesis
LRAFGAEVLHTHNAVANYYGALAALGSGVRLVNTRHGMGAAVPDARSERLFRLSLIRTAAVAAVCARARQQFVAHGIVPSRLAQTVPNGIRVEQFAPASPASRAAARAALGLPADAFVAGTVGRLNWAKDHALLVDSFDRLRAVQSGCCLVIVGDGALRPNIAQSIAQRGLEHLVLMTGDRADVAAILPAFDVFVLTSATEGYSIALLEAAAAGLPAIASDVGGNAEIVQHGVTGTIVHERSATAFAAALRESALAPDARERMGHAARRWVEAHGSVAAMADAYDKLYGAAAAPRRSATA